MRTVGVTLLALAALASCAGRAARIREAALKLEPGCGSFQREEVEAWIWKVDACGQTLWCRGNDFEDMRCGRSRPETELTRRERVHRAALDCPTGELEHDGLSFSRNDGRGDKWRWAREEVRGCERIVWCGEKDEQGESCSRPADAEVAAERVSVESGCPLASIKELQAVREVQAGRRSAEGSSTFRLDACGQIFACTVPLSVPDRSDTLLPDVAGANFSCRPVPAQAPAR